MLRCKMLVLVVVMIVFVGCMPSPQGYHWKYRYGVQHGIQDHMRVCREETGRHYWNDGLTDKSAKYDPYYDEEGEYKRGYDFGLCAGVFPRDGSEIWGEGETK